MIIDFYIPSNWENIKLLKKIGVVKYLQIRVIWELYDLMLDIYYYAWSELNRSIGGNWVIHLLFLEKVFPSFLDGA